jgi:hypothetical protein
VRTILYRIAYWTQYGMLIVGALAAGSLKTDPARFPEAVGDGLTTIQQHAWWIVLASTIAVAIAKALADYIGPPWVREALNRILNRFRKVAFINIDGEPHHKHRVTLFQRKRFWFPIAIPWPGNGQRWPVRPGRWPMSGWMIPVARSGRATQSTRTCFLATDDPNRSEGIVGEVWLTNEVRHVVLPDLGVKPSEAKIAQYASLAGMPTEWIRDRVAKKKPCPRSLCGVPIEVGNRFWGVLVLESAGPDTIDYQGHGWKAFTDMVQPSIEELLKRI